MQVDMQTREAWTRRLHECADGLDLTDQEDRAVFRVHVIHASRGTDPQVLLALAGEYGRTQGDNRCGQPGCALACGYLDARDREWASRNR